MREVGNGVVVAVGLIELEHHELGVVRRVGALVAEVAVDLEDSFDSADHRALEEQFGGDAQEQFHVERVGVRDERAGGGAAVHRLQHRCFDLEEAVFGESLAQGRHRLRAGDNVLAGLVSHDEIEVALANPRLFVQFGVEVRQRQQRLRRHLPFGHEDRQFAALGRNDFALDEHVVTEVDEFFPPFEGVLADDVE